MCDYIKHIVDTILTKTNKQPMFFSMKDEAGLFDSISISQADYTTLMSHQAQSNKTDNPKSPLATVNNNIDTL
jgi:hypothetical protein